MKIPLKRETIYSFLLGVLSHIPDTLKMSLLPTIINDTHSSNIEL